jgi:LmbE family N-acetylglucosaminyl deacetylase
MAAVASTLTRLFAERHARIVFTHPYEGGHPDHDATAFAVHAACRTLENAGELAPQCVEMAFYHAGRDGLVLQDFSPDPSSRTIEIELATGALATKRRMLAHHATQRRTLAPFSDARERFRFAPSYDFRKLPNRGRLYYEDLPVHFRGPDWPPLVDRALENLGLAGT